MKPYQARPFCSSCGSLRMKARIEAHNIECANTGERSYPGTAPTRKSARLSSLQRVAVDLNPAKLFYQGRSGRRTSIPGAA